MTSWKNKIDNLEFKGIKYRKVTNQTEYDGLVNTVDESVKSQTSGETDDVLPVLNQYYFDLKNVVLEAKKLKDVSLGLSFPIVTLMISLFSSFLLAYVDGDILVMVSVVWFFSNMGILLFIARRSNQIFEYRNDILDFYERIEEILNEKIRICKREKKQDESN